MALLWQSISQTSMCALRPCLRSPCLLPSFITSDYFPSSRGNSYTGFREGKVSIRCLHNELNGNSLFSLKTKSISQQTLSLRFTTERWLHQKEDKFSHAAVLSPKWVVDASPASLKPYLQLIRFDRPIGTWLVYLPSTWSIAMATPPAQIPDLKLLGLFALGAFLMRGAGCTINDMWDRDFDARVERTHLRPLACGKLSNFRALVFLGCQLSCALAVLVQLNTYTILLGAACMGPVVIYPLMKRVIYWPHVFLGITLNWGVLMGWSAVQGHCEWTALLPLYVSGIMLTTIYDLIYAHQDKDDDFRIGVKSAALKLGEDSKKWLTAFATVMVGGLSLSGYMCDQSLPFYAGVSLVAAHLAHQIYTVDLSNGEDCARKFRSNKYLGMFLFMAIAAGTYFKVQRSDKTSQEIDTVSVNI